MALRDLLCDVLVQKCKKFTHVNINSTSLMTQESTKLMKISFVIVAQHAHAGTTGVKLNAAGVLPSKSESL